MRPIGYLLAAIVGLTGCASTPPPKERPLVSQAPRIKLKPSPGKEPRPGGFQKEVLESDPETGFYFAWLHQMPPTRYFLILGPYDCHEWVSTPFLTARSMQIFPEDAWSGRMGERQAATNQCLAKLKDKAVEDPSLRERRVDGVILDMSARRFTDAGFFTGWGKIKFDGWAIQFVEPTLDEIRARLNTLPNGEHYNTIANGMEEQQVRAAAFWVMQNRATQFAPAMREMYLRLYRSPQATNTALLSALASVEPDSADDELWWRILEQQGQPNGTPYEIAVNVLVCRNKPGTVPRMEKAFRKAVRMTQISLAKGLRTLNRQDLVMKHTTDPLIISNGTGPSWDPLSTYHCPYQGGASAHWWQ